MLLIITLYSIRREDQEYETLKGKQGKLEERENCYPDKLIPFPHGISFAKLFVSTFRTLLQIKNQFPNVDFVKHGQFKGALVITSIYISLSFEIEL